MKKNAQQIDFYVLIPYYNDPEGLVQSLQSIDYYPGKFSILIVDDGSALPIDQTSLLSRINPEIAVQIIRLPANQGIARALNKGLEWLSDQDGYKYIARLDCGDICEKDRFYRQVAFLDKHPETDLLGSWCTFKDYATGNAYLYKTPTRLNRIEKSMYFRNIFIHPTVMWRAAAKRQLYPEIFPHAEDYGLFYAFMRKKNYAILPENLVTCKLNRNGISLKHRKEQLRSRMEVVKHYGRNKLLTALGVLKVKLMMFIPYTWIWQIKRILYG